MRTAEQQGCHLELRVTDCVNCLSDSDVVMESGVTVAVETDSGMSLIVTFSPPALSAICTSHVSYLSSDLLDFLVGVYICSSLLYLLVTCINIRYDETNQEL